MSRAYLVTCDICGDEKVVNEPNGLPREWALVQLHTKGLGGEFGREDFSKLMHLCLPCRAHLFRGINKALANSTTPHEDPA